ncbi:MAG: Rha family transcriptional regulator [Janthinobacterium lividum]
MVSLVYTTKKGNAATDSLKVAEKFGKRHDNVLATYRKLEISDDFNALNFKEIPYTDSRGRQKAKLVMTRAGFIRLVFGFTGKKAAAFKEDYITEFDRMEQQLRSLADDSPIIDLLAHTSRQVQVANSKSINNHQYLLGGVNGVIQYNRQNCKLHTGKRPSEIKADAKLRGLPSRLRTSAKEVLRHDEPETACCMSLADEMVRRGASLNEAAAVTIGAKAVFAGIMQLGFRPAQLSS